MRSFAVLLLCASSLAALTQVARGHGHHGHLGHGWDSSAWANQALDGQDWMVDHQQFNKMQEAFRADRHQIYRVHHQQATGA